MPWIAIGAIIPHPDKWLSTLALSASPLIRISWFKGDAPLDQIKSKFLIRRRFSLGDIDKAQIIYPSNEPLILPYKDLGENFYIQIKKLLPRCRIVSEPPYTIQIEYYQEQVQ